MPYGEEDEQDRGGVDLPDEEKKAVEEDGPTQVDEREDGDTTPIKPAATPASMAVAVAIARTKAIEDAVGDIARTKAIEDATAADQEDCVIGDDDHDEEKKVIDSLVAPAVAAVTESDSKRSSSPHPLAPKQERKKMQVKEKATPKVKKVKAAVAPEEKNDEKDDEATRLANLPTVAKRHSGRVKGARPEGSEKNVMARARVRRFMRRARITSMAKGCAEETLALVFAIMHTITAKIAIVGSARIKKRVGYDAKKDSHYPYTPAVTLKVDDLQHAFRGTPQRFYSASD